MSPKKLVQNFYHSDAMIDSTLIQQYLHPDIQLEWHSSKGYFTLNHAEIIDFIQKMQTAYVGSFIKIASILAEHNLVSVRYDHFVNTIENPNEDMLLAHFLVIWEIKDDKLFKGYQISQIIG